MIRKSLGIGHQWTLTIQKTRVNKNYKPQMEEHSTTYDTELPKNFNPVLNKPLDPITNLQN